MRGCTCTGLPLCPQCTSFARRAGILAPPQPPALTEAAFQQAVVRLAKEAGYTLAYHTYRSTHSPAGFPDLLLAHEDAQRDGRRGRRSGWPLWAVELKTDTGQVTAAQQAWLDALAGSRGVLSAVWRPSHWAEIVEALRR